MSTQKILLARVKGAHGIKGEVKLVCHATDPSLLLRIGTLESARGDKFQILRVKEAKDHLIAAIKGVNDRNLSESMRGLELFADRNQLPEPEAHETYIADLIGRRVETADHAFLGTVEDVVNYGAGDLLEVRMEDRRDTVLIPYATGYVVEERAGALVVDLPEGFLDTE